MRFDRAAAIKEMARAKNTTNMETRTSILNILVFRGIQISEGSYQPTVPQNLLRFMTRNSEINRSRVQTAVTE